MPNQAATHKREEETDPWQELHLHPDHKADLLKSGLFPETVRILGIGTVPPQEIDHELGFHNKRITSVLRFPYPGEDKFCRYKIFPTDLKDKDGSGMRYRQREKTGCRLYIPLPLLPQGLLRDPIVPLRFTEGEKKAVKACQEGYPTIGLGGLWNFGKAGELIPKFDEIALKGRHIILVPDAEVWGSRRDLLLPVYRFGKLLEERGAI